MFDNKSEITKETIRVPKSEIRILLWDIDGTLMASTRPGSYREYFAPALERVFGSSGRLADLNVSGMTDTQIAYEALRDQGLTPERILAEKENLLRVFKEEMSRVLSVWENPYFIYQGVREILGKTAESPLFINALLTGNLSCAAELKLTSVDLWQFFTDVPHAFGEISHDRRDLAREAGRLYNRFLQTELRPEQFIVIGDTPNDIACARAFGARAVSVATGRNNPAQVLARHQPDLLLENLKQTENLFRSFSEL
ncbi:MAG: HAD hydrolase-like protein [Pyrinomonadaceae bacterium]